MLHRIIDGRNPLIPLRLRFGHPQPLGHFIGLGVVELDQLKAVFVHQSLGDKGATYALIGS